MTLFAAIPGPGPRSTSSALALSVTASCPISGGLILQNRRFPCVTRCFLRSLGANPVLFWTAVVIDRTYSGSRNGSGSGSPHSETSGAVYDRPNQERVNRAVIAGRPSPSPRRSRRSRHDTRPSGIAFLDINWVSLKMARHTVSPHETRGDFQTDPLPAVFFVGAEGTHAARYPRTDS